MTDTIELLRQTLADRYEIVRELGRGGMATVYLAKDLKHSREVAIKVLLPDLAASVGHDRFLREIEIAANLQHPHILPVYDSGEAGGLLFYVMPYVKGESLKELIERNGALPDKEAFAICREVASALGYAHRQGIVHRDIKPANILLSEGHAVVADFGIARAISVSGGEGLTQVGMAVGTPAYMSPEQALGETDLDGRTDIYALGCVLYEMLAGKPAFTGSTPQSVLAKAMTGERARLEGVRSSVEAVLDKALAREPDDRYETSAEFRLALDSPAEKAAPSRWHTARIVGITAAVAVVAFAAFSLLRPSSAASAVASDAQVIAVVPFSTRGQSVELLGEGMVDLLASNLDAVGGIKVVDPGRVLKEWRRVGDGEQVSLEDELSVGRRVDAGSVLSGSVIEAGDAVRLSAKLTSVNGEELVSTTLDGPANDVLALVDSLSIRLLREVWRSRQELPNMQVAAITSGSPEAIRAYLRGARHLRRLGWDSAITAFSEAVRRDSSFALAHARLANAYAWRDGPGSPSKLDHLARAGRFLNRLPSRQRSLVFADRLSNDDPYAALDTLRSYLARFPEDAAAWEQLGDVQFHLMAALDLSLDELYEPFDRAIAIDPSYTPAYIHPLEIAFSQADSARVNRYFRYIDEESANAEFVDRYRAIAAVVWGSADSLTENINYLLQRWPPGLLNAASASYRGGSHSPEALATMLDGGRSNLEPNSEERMSAAQVAFTLFLSLGQRENARRIAREEYEANPQFGSGLIAGLYTAGYISQEEAEPVMAMMRRYAPSVVMMYLQAIRGSREMDAGTIRTAIAAVRADTSGVIPIYGSVMDAFDGIADIVAGDTGTGIAKVRAAFGDAGVAMVSSQMFTPIRYHLAFTLTASEATRQEGIDMLRSQYTDGFVTDYGVLPFALLGLGEALEAEGDPTGAALAYSRFVDLWSNADEELMPQVEEARRRIADLTGEN